MQIRSRGAEEARGVLGQLASWSVVSYGDAVPRDSMDPLRWRDVPDMRLVAVAEPIVGRLLIGAAASLEYLTELEKATLTERLTESKSQFLQSGPGQGIALLALYNAGLVASDLVWAGIRNLVSTDVSGGAVARLFAEGLVRTEQWA